MIQHRERLVWWAGAILAFTLIAWSLVTDRGVAGSTQVDEKTIPLKPSITFVKASFLTGELRDLRVTERVEHGTGKAVGTPLLRATLTVTNDSENQAARLLGGKIEYIDSKGMQIQIAHTAFPFVGVSSDRLDPGMHTSLVIDVLFPSTALKPNAIREVRLELIYLPITYREDTVKFPVYLGG